ncbi:hypothetical protein L1049_001319 [Liquidambar formosana]|uniref:B box-type domain-containing protein n=1 Tax=Liquidambar formosana TaxID=63359 RepID=A0AAP0NBA3_LIQFO
MKECELCSDPARMYCESDQASLCWDCDEKVHCANFLVARHSRSLLCHVCQSPTPWKASGPKLGHTVSVCDSCVTSCNGKRERGGDEESRGGNEEEDEDDNDDDDDDEEDEEDEDGEYRDGGVDDDGENQVVPWSTTPPPPAVASSSSSEAECSGSYGGGGVSALKRIRENADLDSDDDIACSSSLSSLRPVLKERRTSEPIHSARLSDHGEAEFRSTAVVSSLKRFQEKIISGNDVPATILGIRNLSRDPRAVDFNFPVSGIRNPTV